MSAQVKTCRGCAETKPASAFYASKSHKDGLQTYCKPCKIAQKRVRNVVVRRSAATVENLFAELPDIWTDLEGSNHLEGHDAALESELRDIFEDAIAGDNAARDWLRDHGHPIPPSLEQECEERGWTWRWATGAGPNRVRVYAADGESLAGPMPPAYAWRWVRAQAVEGVDAVDQEAAA